MKEYLAQEKKFTFSEFTHEYALVFGNKVNRKVQERKLKPVRIRVYFDGDIVFQYLMDGKKGEEWLDRKQKTVMDSGHASIIGFNKQKTEPYKSWAKNDEYTLGGGGFPIFVEDKLRGAFCVSGLAHDQDHQLIVDILQEMFEDYEL